MMVALARAIDAWQHWLSEPVYYAGPDRFDVLAYTFIVLVILAGIVAVIVSALA